MVFKRRKGDEKGTKRYKKGCVPFCEDAAVLAINDVFSIRFTDCCFLIVGIADASHRTCHRAAGVSVSGLKRIDLSGGMEVENVHATSFGSR